MRGEYQACMGEPSLLVFSGRYLEGLRLTTTDVPGYVATNPFRDDVLPSTTIATVATIETIETIDSPKSTIETI